MRLTMNFIGIFLALLFSLFQTQVFAASCVSLKCHADILSGKSVHGPLKAKGCHVCHLRAEGHESSPDSHPLLKPIPASKVEAQCRVCHESFVDDTVSIRSVHEAIKEKNCLQCHDPHHSKYRHLLKDSEPPGFCLSCHSKFERQLKSLKHTHISLEKADSCASCHVAHVSTFPSLLKLSAAQLCKDCHAKGIVTRDKRKISGVALDFSRAASVHKPVQEGKCMSCHLPHGSNHSALLSKNMSEKTYVNFDEDQYALCFSCHKASLVTSRAVNSETKFRNQNLNLHYVHVVSAKGRNCAVCHESHSSENPKLLKSSVRLFGIDTPLEFRATSSGGSCATACHGDKAYDRVKEVKNAFGR